MKCDGTNSAGANCQITPKHFHIFDVAFILAVIRVMKFTYIARFHNARIQNNTVIEFVRQHTLNIRYLCRGWTLSQPARHTGPKQKYRCSF